jgi:hypothetical protein
MPVAEPKTCSRFRRSKRSNRLRSACSGRCFARLCSCGFHDHVHAHDSRSRFKSLSIPLLSKTDFFGPVVLSSVVKGGRRGFVSDARKSPLVWCLRSSLNKFALSRHTGETLRPFDVTQGMLCGTNPRDNDKESSPQRRRGHGVRKNSYLCVLRASAVKSIFVNFVPFVVNHSVPKAGIQNGRMPYAPTKISGFRVALPRTLIRGCVWCTRH